MATAVTKKGKYRLTNTGKRYNMTLDSVMSIKIPFNGQYIECSTPAEAIAVLKYLNDEDSKKITHRVPGIASTFTGPTSAIAQLLNDTVYTSAWTRESFWKFIENLGDSQKRILVLLKRNTKVSDEALRKALKLDSNQALAGVLSGISKQAGILNIPARAVYTVEDERKGGELSKTYVAANDFLRIANEMNWPEE